MPPEDGAAPPEGGAAPAERGTVPLTKEESSHVAP